MANLEESSTGRPLANEVMSLVDDGDLLAEALEQVRVAQVETARWDNVKLRLPPVRESCDDVLAGCDNVARSVEECLGFAKATPAQRHVDSIAEWTKERAIEDQRRRRLEDKLRGVIEHRDKLLERMEAAVGDSPIIRSLLMFGHSTKSRASTSHGPSASHGRYNTTSVLSSLDVGDDA
mmetsp:Transcript_6964/g.10306  ORF Transcript_6964/g.10306 Transcript_6964/m.10306 type:complete len:179 (+) Transcript_6964:48-584(+)